MSIGQLTQIITIDRYTHANTTAERLGSGLECIEGFRTSARRIDGTHHTCGTVRRLLELLAVEPDSCNSKAQKESSIELKWHLRAVALVMVTFHSGVGLTPAAGMKTQPESNPPLNGVQGLEIE